MNNLQQRIQKRIDSKMKDCEANSKNISDSIVELIIIENILVIEKQEYQRELLNRVDGLRDEAERLKELVEQANKDYFDYE